MKMILYLIVFALFSTSAHGATWELYFENQRRNKFYVEKESIHQTPEGTTLVWTKVTGTTDSGKKVTVEILYEIDCSRRRCKHLQGTRYVEGGGITPIDKSEWGYIEPEGPTNTLFKEICAGKFNK